MKNFLILLGALLLLSTPVWAADAGPGTLTDAQVAKILKKVAGPEAQAEKLPDKLAVTLSLKTPFSVQSYMIRQKTTGLQFLFASLPTDHPEYLVTRKDGNNVRVLHLNNRLEPISGAIGQLDGDHEPQVLSGPDAEKAAKEDLSTWARYADAIPDAPATPAPAATNTTATPEQPKPAQ